MMKWYIVYRGKAARNSITENLSKADIVYYEAIQKMEYLGEDKMELKEEKVLKNLIFIRTDRKIHEVIKEIDGLKAPYLNRATRQPATVKDEEMQRFMDVVKFQNIKAEFLQDPYRKFTNGQKVRVREGDFKDLEGYVFRMRGDRKLIIKLGEMAVAISGIHHTLLEPIESEEY